MSEKTFGILNKATQDVLVLADDKIIVRNNIKINGTIEAGLIRATELIADQRYEKQYLEFASDAGVIGSGLLWVSKDSNKQFVLRNNPSRFWSTESLDIPRTESYMIDGLPVISATYLGNTVTHSNLQNLGALKKLTVVGDVNISDTVFFNNSTGRLGIGTQEPNGKLSIIDDVYNVEFVIDSDNEGNAKLGTYNTKGLSVITDNQSRVFIDSYGNVTIGYEQKDTNITRIFGKVGLGVKNPRETLEIAGNIKWSNKLFTVGNKVPEDGHYVKGDIIWNSDPKTNAYIGWVCISTGAPGTWRPFGLIQP